MIWRATSFRCLMLLGLWLSPVNPGGLGQAHAQQPAPFPGDKKLACEAVLCLSSGTRPSECHPSLNRYFGITDWNPAKQFQKRLSFLNQCPSGSYSGKQSHITALAQGAGNCDMSTLLQRHNLSSPPYTTALPGHCVSFVNHQFTTQQALPVKQSHCSTAHLAPLGPPPDPNLASSTVVTQYTNNLVLQQGGFQKICITQWVDPRQPVPLPHLNQVLDAEITRVVQQYVATTGFPIHHYAP